MEEVNLQFGVKARVWKTIWHRVNSNESTCKEATGLNMFDLNLAFAEELVQQDDLRAAD